MKNNIAIRKYDGMDLQDSLPHNSSTEGVYGYSNENLRAYIDLLNLKDGRVATVGSSGDQAFYAIYKGAKEVTLIDGNPFTKPMVELKKSAIEKLTFKEFRKYWITKHILYEPYFDDLLIDISESSKDFLLYARENRKNQSRLFQLCTFGYKDMAGYTPLSGGSEFYDNETKFATLKSRLQNTKIDVKIAGFDNFCKTLNGKYSTIMLSNIYDYYYNDGKTEEFFKEVKNLASKRLDKDGTMQVHYSFCGSDRFETGVNQSKYIDKDDVDVYIFKDSLFGNDSQLDKAQKVSELSVNDLKKSMVYILEK